jgi:PBSX family phage terminase large subunit
MLNSNNYLLASLQRHVSRKSLTKSDYLPYGTIKQVFNSEEKMLCVSGPAGTGKTRGIFQKLVACAKKYRGIRVLIARKTRESMSETVLATLEEEVLGLEHPVIGRLKRQNRSVYTFPNSSIFVILGLDQPTRLRSGFFDLVYFAEATEIPQTAINNALRGLRHFKMPYQQLILDTNPGTPSHYLYQQHLSGDLKMYFSTHTDNPVYVDQDTLELTERGRDYMATLDLLTGVDKLRMKYGKWVRAEGAVYDYDASVHLTYTDALPAFRKRYRVVDFGFTDPFVCLWIGEDNDGRLYVYRELYETGKLVEDHAKTIAHYSQNERYEATICDHDAEDRFTLERHLKCSTTKAYKPILVGIDAVKSRLRVAGDGHARLQFCRDSLIARDESLRARGKPTCLLEEIENYVYALDKDSQIKSELPQDDSNHSLDSLRYACAFVDKLGEQQATRSAKGALAGLQAMRTRARPERSRTDG